MAPRRRLGQHFLRDNRVLATIVTALEIRPGDRVVEIGAGQGILTRELAIRAADLTAIELDDALAARLVSEFRAHDNVRIIHANALDLDPCDLTSGDTNPGKGDYKLAGNIPYYISGALIRHYVDTTCRPTLAVLMLQMEVARRIIAGPGEMSLLAVSVQLYAEPSIVTSVPPMAFRPPPKVDSAVVKLRMLDQPRVPIHDTRLFFAIVRSGFSGRRKQLVNSIAHGLKIAKTEARHVLDESGIPPVERPQDLTLEDWGRLTEVVAGKALVEVS